MIRVLVAEDSPTTRALIVAVLRAEPGMAVIGETDNGEDAVTLTQKLRPDVVTMDITMPRLDGFEATSRIMITSPTPIVIVSASADAHRVAVSMQALRAGALTVLQSPSKPEDPDFLEACRHFVNTVRAMAQVKVVRRWPDARAREVRISERPPNAACNVIAVAASTGGPAALFQLIAELPPSLTVPLVVVQHIAGGFTTGFATWLGSASSRLVKVASDGERLTPSTVYIAPDDHHLALSDRMTLATSRAAPLGGFRPSATVLFSSVARTHASQGVGVILTGMGQDGLEGLRDLRRAGGRVLAQDEASSVVFGMPGAVVAAGVADEVLPLRMIPLRLGSLARTP